MKADLVTVADPNRTPAAPARDGRAVAPDRRAEPAPQTPDPAQLDAARAVANEALARIGSELAFEFDDELNRVIAKLIDRKTREVIRQVPSEAVLAIARALAEGEHSGAIVRARA
jgi:flagellar protein FlaG